MGEGEPPQTSFKVGQFSEIDSHLEKSNEQLAKFQKKVSFLFARTRRIQKCWSVQMSKC